MGSTKFLGIVFHFLIKTVPIPKINFTLFFGDYLKNRMRFTFREKFVSLPHKHADIRYERVALNRQPFRIVLYGVSSKRGFYLMKLLY